MNLQTTRAAFKTSLLAAALFGACGSFAATATMTKADHSAAKDRITAEYKADKAACDKLTDNAKDVCVQEAKAKEKVARAELEYNYTGKAKDANKLAMVKAETTYDVAKEKCDDLKGNDKDVCVKEAKATETKAKADAKAAQKVTDARKDASEEKSEANYKAAAEKCDSMTGDAKSACVANAKATYGKS